MKAVVKRIPVYLLGVLCMFGCNGGQDKNKKADSDVVAKKEKNEYSHLLTDLSTSENMYDILCQGWEMKDDREALKGMEADSKLEIPFRSFYFSTDGSFVKNPRNAIEYGTWKYDDATKMISLDYTDEPGNDSYQVRALAADELKLTNKGINTMTVLEFAGEGMRFKDPANEPFHISNNRWRIAPLKKETDDEVKKRLKDHLHFFILFYRGAIGKSSQHVSFWGLPSCLKWYGGAIFMKRKDELDERWVECFYNADQAMQAYRIMSGVMDKKYKWPDGSQNWIQKNLAVLEQMYVQVDSVGLK